MKTIEEIREALDWCALPWATRGLDVVSAAIDELAALRELLPDAETDAAMERNYRRDVAAERDAARADLATERAKREEAERQAAWHRAILSRRPALDDLPTDAAKIERAINTAKRADEEKARADAAEARATAAEFELSHSVHAFEVECPGFMVGVDQCGKCRECQRVRADRAEAEAAALKAQIREMGGTPCR